jgi:hypothetical protein
MSFGQQLTKEFFIELTGLTPEEDHRPEWMHGLEIDLWFPAIGLGVEFQGDQHYMPVYGHKALFRQRLHDTIKKDIAKNRGIALICVKAIDLEYGRLTMKLKTAGKKILSPMRKMNPDYDKLRELNKRATEYRKTLVANFASPSCRRGKCIKKQKKLWREKYS